MMVGMDNTVAPGEADDERETGRLEAFSDGVLAVIITIMALELKAPAGGTFTDLRTRLPELLVYILSFTIIGIYWNNHHHMLRTARRVSGAVMWSNLHLLFWLSLVPVITSWVGSHWRETAPAATYAVVALGSAIAYTVLQRAIVRAEGPESKLARALERDRSRALGSDTKGRLSILGYVAAFCFSFATPVVSYIFFVAVALVWLVPDRRLDHPLPAG
jgi:TMEM175 potassium channel family protein